jgi:hypothetical protein
MKKLKETGLIFSIFIGGFVLSSLSIVLIFPVTWNQVVTFPYWIIVYMIFGSMLAIHIVEEWDK